MQRTQEQLKHEIEPRPEYPGRPIHTASTEIGHWVRTAGILAPLIIGEIVKDPDKKWRFIRITSVAMALVSEGLHAHRIKRERREQKTDRSSGVPQR
jgi:hypothetical protein